MSETKTEIQKMTDGELYDPSDPEIKRVVLEQKWRVRKFNETYPDEEEYRCKLLHEIFPNCTKPFYIEPPVHCDLGFNCYFGEGVYMNFDAAILDICPIRIGARSLFGPRTSFYAATHPIDHTLRNTGIELGKPITVGEDCFVGGSTVFVPGVTVGDRVVIGSGSVVCKDLPSDCVAVGNPCHVIKRLNNADERKDAAKEYASS